MRGIGLNVGLLGGGIGGISILIGDVTAPLKPTLAETSTDATTITLAITIGSDLVGITGTKIYVKTSAASSYGAAIDISGSSTSYVITGLTDGTEYNIKATHVDAAGNESLDSNVLTSTAEVPGGSVVIPQSGLIGAWGTRMLVDGYTGNAMQLKGSTDIGFSGIEINQSAVDALTGPLNITKLYNQINNANGTFVTDRSSVLYNASGINSKPSLGFDGDSCLNSGNTFTMYASDFHYFIVYEVSDTSGSGVQYLMNTDNTSSSSNREAKIQTFQIGSTMYQRVWDNTGSPTQITVTSSLNTSPHILETYAQPTEPGDDVGISFDGGTYSLSHSGSSKMKLDPQNWRLGDDGSNSSIIGNISEIILYNRKLTTAEALVVNNDIKSRYGIS